MTISWRQRDGTPVACREKLKMLTENTVELRQALQDHFEDAVLMGVDPQQIRDELHREIDQLKESWGE